MWGVCGGGREGGRTLGVLVCVPVAKRKCADINKATRVDGVCDVRCSYASQEGLGRDRRLACWSRAARNISTRRSWSRACLRDSGAARCALWYTGRGHRYGSRRRARAGARGDTSRTVDGGDVPRCCSSLAEGHIRGCRVRQLVESTEAQMSTMRRRNDSSIRRCPKWWTRCCSQASPRSRHSALVIGASVGWHFETVSGRLRRVEDCSKNGRFHGM